MLFCCVNILLFLESLQIEQTQNNVAKLVSLFAIKEIKPDWPNALTKYESFF